MTLKQDLAKLVIQWRQIAIKGRLAAEDIPHLMGRGHIYGMSDAFDVAADDVDKLLESPNGKSPAE